MGVCYPQPLLFGGGLAGTNAYILINTADVRPLVPYKSAPEEKGT